MDCDVLVAGGGSAGLAGAVAAARLGARTLLVDRHGMLGGMASAALVHSICGLYRLGEGGQPPVLANGGFAAEFSERLLAVGGASGPIRMGRVEVLLQRPSAFAQLADVFVRETPNLEVRLHTEIIGTDAAATVLSCRGAAEKVHALAFVDATGDAALATLRGARCEMADGAQLQRPAFIFALGGVSGTALADDARLRLAQRIGRAIQSGRLPGAAVGAHLRSGVQEGEAYVTIDLAGGPAFNPLDAACLTRLEMEGRELGARFLDFLRAESEGFERSYLAAWPSRAGVRESRRIVGRARLETADVETGAQFADQVAFAAWPMELRETAVGPRLRFPTGDQPCGIRLGALRARDDDALFMAGRCISCSHEAQASVRVIGTCLATGEAAGLAAGLQALGCEVTAGAVNEARRKVSG
jgi:hypothetical protein